MGAPITNPKIPLRVHYVGEVSSGKILVETRKNLHEPVLFQSIMKGVFVANMNNQGSKEPDSVQEISGPE